MNERFRHWLLLRLAEYGDRPFLHTAEGSWSYAELVVEIERCVRELGAAGIRPGEVTAILSDYSLVAIARFLALVENRNILVPVATSVAHEVRDRLEVVQATRVFRSGQPVENILPDTSVEPPELLVRVAVEGRAGLVLFSSGSTGRPKAMVHDLDRLIDTYRDRRARNLTIMVFLMFDHIGGLNTLFTALASGAAIVIPGTREPEAVCALIARYRVVVLPASPTFLNLVLLSEAWKRHDLSSLKIITYGAEPMPEGLLVRLRATFPRVRFIQTFGTSETGISHTSSKSSESTLLKIEDPNTEHKIVEGELWLRSHTQILGYLNHDMDSFTADGWFKTGDLVEQHPDGFLRVVGRRKELINVGGEKVLPGEVESVLLELPVIADCLVYGAPNPVTGQIVCAQVVLVPGADREKIRQQVRLHCRERLAGFKIPVKVFVVESTTCGDRFKKMRLTVSAGAPDTRLPVACTPRNSGSEIS